MPDTTTTSPQETNATTDGKPLDETVTEPTTGADAQPAGAPVPDAATETSAPAPTEDSLGSTDMGASKSADVVGDASSGAVATETEATNGPSPDLASNDNGVTAPSTEAPSNNEAAPSLDPTVSSASAPAADATPAASDASTSEPSSGDNAASEVASDPTVAGATTTPADTTSSASDELPASPTSDTSLPTATPTDSSTPSETDLSVSAPDATKPSSDASATTDSSGETADKGDATEAPSAPLFSHPAPAETPCIIDQTTGQPLPDEMQPESPNDGKSQDGGLDGKASSDYTREESNEMDDMLAKFKQHMSNDFDAVRDALRGMEHQVHKLLQKIGG